MKGLENWLKEKLFIKPKVTNAPIKGQSLAPHSPQQHTSSSHIPRPHYKQKPFFVKKGNDFLRIIPLGGLSQVGRNMTAFETNNDIIIIDCGLQFPEENMLGIDYVIPDVSYLENNRNKIRGILITHGHLDHIGALKHILPKLGFPPVYGSRLTIGLIQKQLDEVNMTQGVKLHSVEHTEKIRLGSFQASFVRITHNIPGAFTIALRTPVGNIVHTGDFKLDVTAPFPNDVPDFEKLALIGNDGVLFLLSDSTNAPIEGFAKPEIAVGETLNKIIQSAKGRIIVGSFSSNIARLQEVINSAQSCDRKVFLSGRSMINNVAIAKKLGYLKFPEKCVSKISKATNALPLEKVLIFTTGSQGEEFAALSRMANNLHAHIQIQPGDTIVLSSSPIPGTGNERAIYNNINKFLQKGAIVITNEDLDVHASGHGKKEDLRIMLQLIRPQFFIPVHGELYMRNAHKRLALEEKIPENNIFLLDNGSVLEVEQGQRPMVHKQKLELQNVYVDGLGGTETEATKVFEERKNMSQDGMVILMYKVSSQDRKLIGAPKMITKGFIYQEELEKMTTAILKESKQIYLDVVVINKNASQKDLRREIINRVSTMIYKKLGREPLIIPIIVEM